MAEEIIFPKNITIIIGCFNVIQSIEEIDLSQYDKLKKIKQEKRKKKDTLEKKVKEEKKS